MLAAVSCNFCFNSYSPLASAVARKPHFVSYALYSAYLSLMCHTRIFYNFIGFIALCLVGLNQLFLIAKHLRETLLDKLCNGISSHY